MAVFEWRRFNFFDLRPNADKGKVIEATKEAEITSSVSGRGQIILCDNTGSIHIFESKWDYISFKGHDSAITLCCLSLHNNLLVTLANDENAETPTFKVWNLAKKTKNNGAPCLRTVKTFFAKATCLAVSENGQYMAIGFAGGDISLYQGDIGRDKSKIVKTFSFKTKPITGISFKQQEKYTYMFVCSDGGVVVYNVYNKDREIKIVLDPDNEAARCSTLQAAQGGNESYFIVGKDDAIYCYTVDGRGPCYALKGEKYIIQWFRSHILTVGRAKNTLSSQKEFTFTVIDIKNNLIVFTQPVDTVAAVLIEFGTCFILTQTKEVFELEEKDLLNKLYSLFKKNLYDVAIRIAKSHQYDSEALAGIFKQFGDHLYGKGDYCGAVDQYIKTIGYLEPSYVIRRFLDSRHIRYLTNYLQELHKQGLASPDHTTLLLNCFTRLDMKDELTDFLSNDGKPDISFDIDVAIKVCRNANLNQALELAKRNQKYDQCISILMEEKEAFEEALAYISTLPVQEAEESIHKYGSILMEHCPDRTTELLKKLCTRSPTDSVTLIQFFVKYPEKLIEFLEHVVYNNSNCNAIVYQTLIELYLKKWQTDKSVESRLMEILQTYEDVYDKNHILTLCRMSNFWPGIMWIYEEEKLYHLIVRHHLRTRNYDSLLSCCKRLGSNHPSLWLQALTGLRSDHSAPPSILLQILNVIATEKLQSPLQVLNCLAVENGPNLSSVRDYFLRAFQKEADSAKHEAESVEKSQKKIHMLREHIENLRSQPIEFQNTLCDACNKLLTIPVVYFLCQHSFHQDCIRNYSDNEQECSVCHPRNSQLINALRAQNESRNQQDFFHNMLDRSHDPFAVVSEYLGHGLFNKILVVDVKDNEEINQNILPATKRNVVDFSTGIGAGAEAKLRLNEGNSKIAPSNLIPTSEARIRYTEASRYSSSVGKEKVNMRPKIGPRGSPNTVMKRPKSTGNPFEDGDEDSFRPGNPFEEDKPGNPFEEYDSNLNPA